MPNLAALLKLEITRLARKEARQQVASLKKASGQHRSDIAALKRQVAKLGQHAVRTDRSLLQRAAAETREAAPQTARFAAKGLRRQRERLGLSAADYAKLAGVSAQSVYNWESGSTRPRADQIAVLASLRSIGKREAGARLERFVKKTAPKRRSR